MGSIAKTLGETIAQLNGLLDVNIEGSLRQIEVPEMIVTKLHDSLASLARMTVHAVVLSHVVYGRFSASAVHTGRQDSFRHRPNQAPILFEELTSSEFRLQL